MTSPAPEIPAPAFWPAPRRIAGLALRHIYLYLGSWPRLAEMMYWPMINIALFGFVSLSMVRAFGHVTVTTQAYIAGVLLAEIVTRTVMAVMVMYMEEVWSRNLGHLFASPLRLRDFVGGVLGLGTARCLIAVTPAFALAWFLFGFSVLSLGWDLPLYIALLCFNGFWYGLMILALLMRFGLAAEWLGWMSSWVLMPFMAPYYPVSVLPAGFRAVSWALPGTYVFDSMKAQVATGVARPGELLTAFGLNILYFLVAAFLFTRAFKSARRSGGLLQMGE